MKDGENFNFEALLGLKTPDAGTSNTGKSAEEIAKAEKEAADAAELAKSEEEKRKLEEEKAKAGQTDLGDVFADVFKVTPDGGSSSSDDDDPISRIAKALSFQLPEGVEKWDPDIIVSQTQAQIEANKKKLDLSEYDPEINLLFDYVQNNGGSLMGLLVDPTIRALNEVTLYDPEYFFRLDLGRKYLEQGFAEDEIEPLIDARIAKIDEENRPQFFSDYHQKTIKEVINPAIAARVEVMNKDKAGYREKLKQMAEADKGKVVESMIKTAEQLTDFVGVAISPKSKEAIVSKIKSGDIIKEIEKDPGGYQLLGYLTKTLGPSAVSVWKDVVEKQATSQHYQGVKQALDAVYNSKKGDDPDPNKGLKVNDWSSLRSFIS